MIKLTNINKLYLGEDLLKDITWHMRPGEKIGLIGPNGTGKTTQLRIICKLEDADSGEVYVAPGIKIAYLSQEPIVDPAKTLDQEMFAVFEEVLEAERQINQLQKEISNLSPGPELDEHCKKLAELQAYFEHHEGYTINARIGQVLSGLRFPESDRPRLISTFSGGWQMRMSIAKLLLESPDLLLLDEPTNHLDIKAIEWLENYLSSYKGGYIIVSHDRQFLDRTIGRIIEMDGPYVNLYWGNYTKYLKEKEQQYEAQLAAYNLQQEKIAKDTTFINRFRASATRSSQAKSRERQLDKLELVPPPISTKKVKFNFPVSVKSGDDVLKVQHLFKSFEDNIVFNDVNVGITRGDKIALIGDNGSGKTTLLRIIMQLDADFKGKIRLGHLVKAIYFNQHEARSLSGPKKAFDELHDSAPACTNEQIRTTLARFGIIGDNVFKTLDDLSGGEKARLALSKMLLSGANFLIFDEPTNHLDIPAKEALEHALNSFEGTIIVVSHDRTFIDNFANKIFEIENKLISVYPGNYSYYKFKKEKDSQQIVSANREKPAHKKDQNNKQVVKTDNLHKELSPMAREKKILKIEKAIILTEEEINELEQQLADPDFYNQSPEEFVKISEKADSLRIILNQLNEEWYML